MHTGFSLTFFSCCSADSQHINSSLSFFLSFFLGAQLQISQERENKKKYKSVNTQKLRINDAFEACAAALCRHGNCGLSLLAKHHSRLWLCAACSEALRPPCGRNVLLIALTVCVCVCVVGVTVFERKEGTHDQTCHHKRTCTIHALYPFVGIFLL